MSHGDEQRTVSSRKRNILYLIDKFLADSGFPSTSACLRSEAHLQPDYEICDNVDLDTIYLDMDLSEVLFLILLNCFNRVELSVL